MSAPTPRRRPPGIALVTVTLAGVLATACSTESDPEPDLPGTETSALTRVTDGVTRDLAKYHSAHKAYPVGLALDTGAGRLELADTGEHSTTVRDAKVYRGEVRLGWYRDYADTRVDKPDESGLGAFSLCLSTASGHEVTTGSVLGSAGEVGEGDCPAAPDQPDES